MARKKVEAAIDRARRLRWAPHGPEIKELMLRVSDVPLGTYGVFASGAPKELMRKWDAAAVSAVWGRHRSARCAEII